MPDLTQWACTIYIIFQHHWLYPSKENIATPLAAHCLCSIEFSKSFLWTDCRWFFGVMAAQLPSEDRWANFRATGTADIVWSLLVRDWLLETTAISKIRVILSQSTGQGKMTLKYDQMAFRFTLLGHFPGIRVSMAKKLWIYFSTECKIREVIRQKTSI